MYNNIKLSFLLILQWFFNKGLKKQVVIHYIHAYFIKSMRQLFNYKISLLNMLFYTNSFTSL